MHTPISARSFVTFLILEFALLGLLGMIGAIPVWAWFAASGLLLSMVIVWDRWLQPRIEKLGVAQTILVIGLAGTWLFMTAALGAAGFMIWNNQGFAIGSSIIGGKSDDGPMQWYYNLTMEGGPLSGRNVFSIKFRGANISQKEVKLKDANLISAINGTKIRLEIIAEREIIPLDQIELVPPGAPVDLVAKFGPPDPNAPGKILGLEPKVFLDTWRQFFFIVDDDKKTYRLSFNEGNLAAFFPGMVGPHVTKKAQINAPK